MPLYSYPFGIKEPISSQVRREVTCLTDRYVPGEGDIVQNPGVTAMRV
jgi:hypothetical protein